MFNYRILDAQGKVLGVVSLETEELPKAVMDGEWLVLSGMYSIPSKEFLAFFVTPKPAEEAAASNKQEEAAPTG